MDSKLKQAYLQVSDKKPIQVVLRDKPESGDGVPANLVELKGAVFDSAELAGSPKDWDVCGRIAELCRRGEKSESDVTVYNAVVDKLEIAFRVAIDLRKLIDPDEALCHETIETLLKGVIENIDIALRNLGAR